MFTRIENHDAPGHKLREKDGLLKNRDIDQPVYISHKSYYVRQTSDISTSDGFLDKLGHKKTNGNHELLGNGRPNVNEQYLKSKDYSDTINPSYRSIRDDSVHELGDKLNKRENFNKPGHRSSESNQFGQTDKVLASGGNFNKPSYDLSNGRNVYQRDSEPTDKNRVWIPPYRIIQGPSMGFSVDKLTSGNNIGKSGHSEIGGGYIERSIRGTTFNDLSWKPGDKLIDNRKKGNPSHKLVNDGDIGKPGHDETGGGYIERPIGGSNLKGPSWKPGDKLIDNRKKGNPSHRSADNGNIGKPGHDETGGGYIERPIGESKLKGLSWKPGDKLINNRKKGNPSHRSADNGNIGKPGHDETGGGYIERPIAGSNLKGPSWKPGDKLINNRKKGNPSHRSADNGNIGKPGHDETGGGYIERPIAGSNLKRLSWKPGDKLINNRKKGNPSHRLSHGGKPAKKRNDVQNKNPLESRVRGTTERQPSFKTKAAISNAPNKKQLASKKKNKANVERDGGTLKKHSNLGSKEAAEDHNSEGKKILCKH